MLSDLNKTWHRSSHNTWLFYKDHSDPADSALASVITDVDNRTIRVNFSHDHPSYNIRLLKDDPCPNRLMRNNIYAVLNVVYNTLFKQP